MLFRRLVRATLKEHLPNRSPEKTTEFKKYVNQPSVLLLQKRDGPTLKQAIATVPTRLKSPTLKKIPLGMRLLPSKNEVSASLGSTLMRARAHAHAEVQRLGTARAEAHESSRAQVTARTERGQHLEECAEVRVVEHIVRELNFEPPPRMLQPTPVQLQGESKTQNLPPIRAAQAIALIERIDVFVKSQRPALALTLNHSLGAHAEIERIGPKEVSLKLKGHGGPLATQTIDLIRAELKARGLKVRELHAT